VDVGCTKCGKKGQLRRGLCKNCWTSNRNRVGWETAYVDAQPTRAHVNMLIVAGLGTRRIAALSGVNRKAITQLLHGRPDRGTGPSARVLASTAARIQAVPIPLARHELAADNMPVLAVGTVRRLQALVCIGYTQRYLAGLIGVDDSNASALFHGKRVCVSAARARLVAAWYDQLSGMPPADQVGWARRSRERALALGWADPFAWEDEDIDDPDAQPAPLLQGRVTRHERYQELRELGYTDPEIAKRFDIDMPSLTRWLSGKRSKHAG
jgi:transcriptional regulator with XRE-family HTH domain